MNRNVLHIDMDAFFVSVEEALDPLLAGKPVIVGGDPNGRGVVAAASYAARKYGIHSAMPVARAKRLCPDAIFLRGNHRLYGEFSERIFDILETYSPCVEPMSLDEAYLDLTGCERLHGPTLDTAERIRNQIKMQVGINCSIGIASNKLMAKVASAYAKPSGMLWIPEGMEQKFLAPLPVERIPGIGHKTGQRLMLMGVKTIGHLAALPPELLKNAYGKYGSDLYHKARGISESPVLRRDDSRSISRETTFETDSDDPRFLESTLSYLVEKAASQLRSSRLYTRCITLKLRYSDFQTVTRSQTLPEPVHDDCTIFQTASRLFRKSFSRRTRIRLIGVSLTSLTTDHPAQTDLFIALGSEHWDQLYHSIDRIREKYGFRSILRAASLGGGL